MKKEKSSQLIRLSHINWELFSYDLIADTELLYQWGSLMAVVFVVDQVKIVHLSGEISKHQV